MSLNAPAENVNVYTNELERKINILFDAIDTDPYFSKLDEKTQTELEKELVSELVEKESGISRFVRKEFLKNPVITIGAYEVEPVELQTDEYLQIRKAMREEFRNIGSDNFDPDEELLDRTAFRLINRPYIKSGEKREEMFLNDEKTHTAFSDAWMKADATYQRSIDRFPAHIRSLFYSDSGARIAASSEVAEDEGGWISRHKKLVSLGVLGLIGVATAAYHLSRPKIDKYKPEISELKYNLEISPGDIQRINFTATDMDAKKVVSPENIAKAVVEITGPSGHGVNETARRLEGDLFAVDFKNTTQEGQFKIRSIVEDKAGNVAVEHGSFTVKKELTLVDEIIDFADENNISRETVLALHSKYGIPVENLYNNDKSGLLEVFKLANKNATASEFLIDKIQKDAEIKSEESKLWADVSNALNEIDVYSLTRRQASYINNVTDRHQRNVVLVYGADTLLDVLNTIREHPNINKGYRQELSHWLTLLLKEYPHAADYPFAVYCYGKQAKSMFDEWLRADFVSSEIMDITVDNLQKIIDVYERGESRLSLKENELPWADPVVRENNMRQKLLPLGIFVIDPEIRDTVCPIIWSYLIADNTKYLEMVRKNLDYFSQFHDEVWGMLQDRDSMEHQRARQWWDIRIRKLSPWFNPLGERFKVYNQTIFEHGTIEKDAVLIYGYSDYWIWGIDVNPGGLHEQRVELSQVYGSTVGLPLYYTSGEYPPSKGGGGHQELGWPVTDKFENILLSNYTKYATPIICPKTKSISFYCCEEWLRETGVPYVYILLPSMEIDYLYGEPSK